MLYWPIRFFVDPRPAEASLPLAPEAALTYWKGRYRSATAAGESAAASEALSHSGSALLRLGLPRHAIEHFRAGHVLAVDPLARGAHLANLGVCARQSGELETARRLLHAAAALAAAEGNGALVAYVDLHDRLARVDTKRGAGFSTDAAHSAPLPSLGVDLARNPSPTTAAERALAMAGRLAVGVELVRAGDSDGAAEVLLGTFETLRTNDADTLLMAANAAWIGVLLQQMGDYDTARQYLEIAHESLWQIPALLHLSRVNALLSAIADDAGDGGTAFLGLRRSMQLEALTHSGYDFSLEEFSRVAGEAGAAAESASGPLSHRPAPRFDFSRLLAQARTLREEGHRS